MAGRKQLGKTANLLGALALLIHDRMVEAVEDELGSGGSAPAVLIALGTRPHRSIDALRTTLGLSHSATVRQVDRLVERSLVTRLPGDDGRSTALALTAAGRLTFKRLLERRRRALAALLERLPLAAYEALRQVLPAAVEGVADSREEARRICRLCNHGVCQPCPIGGTVPAELSAPAFAGGKSS